MPRPSASVHLVCALKIRSRSNKSIGSGQARVTGWRAGNTQSRTMNAARLPVLICTLPNTTLFFLPSPAFPSLYSSRFIAVRLSARPAAASLSGTLLELYTQHNYPPRLRASVRLRCAAAAAAACAQHGEDPDEGPSGRPLREAGQGTHSDAGGDGGEGRREGSQLGTCDSSGCISRERFSLRLIDILVAFMGTLVSASPLSRPVIAQATYCWSATASSRTP